MQTPREPSDDATARRGMEGLIAAMRARRGASTTVSVCGPEDELPAVVWRAMHVSFASSSDEGEGCTDDEPAYLEPGAVMGRYVVLRKLGAGGMGVVHAAYDPELDRKVALKLVLPGRGDGEGRTRLLREAQALAKLSHRNVVAVHDVGTMSGQVWLAMEFVRGQTLREWLRTPRPWRDVLEVLRKAGRGLAAAHAAGLLHRDFKPDNVMVGARGRVRVMDFGLARARPNAVPLAAEESTLEAVPVLDTLAVRVTQAGTLLGTPLYMAPEQLLGREPTPAVDQYALCVTLWEALHGERPFAGQTLDELVEAVIAGKVREPSSGRGVPRWLRRVCERGLSTQPQQRFASMAELLDALANGQARARVRKGLAAVGVVALLGVGGGGYQRLERVQRIAACDASGVEIETAWNAERRRALHDALVATGASSATMTADKVMPWLERQAEAWREARVDACLDAEVRQRWSAETLDRSLWCLDERRMELRSLVDELTSADAAVLQKAVPAAVGLSSVAPCRDETLLEWLVPPPEAHREAIRAVWADVAWAGNLSRAGRLDRGLAVARGALERAEALQWRPLSAGARLRVGELLMDTGAFAEAETALEAAYFEAAQGVAPEVAFDAATRLVFVVGYRGSRHAEGRRWGRHAELALASLRDGEHLDRASLLHGLASIHMATGSYGEAKTLFEQALVLGERALGPHHPNVARSLNNLAGVHRAMGDYEEAKARYGRALAIKEETLGSDHPDLAMGLNNLANIYAATGASAEAKALYERALAIQEKALGAEHPDLAMTLNNLANVLDDAGASEEAKALYERALAIQEKALGAEHPDLAMTLSNLANLLDEAGASEEAKVLYERALAIQEKVLGPDHPDLARNLKNLADVLASTGASEEAKVAYERALAITEKALGADHPDAALTLMGLADLALDQRRWIEAVTLAQRAVSVCEQGSVGADWLADARFVLARALWEASAAGGRDRARAVRLAEQARDAFRDAGKGGAEDLEAVEAWLGNR
jgi:tetratricopeptide (TPR) repeat protein/predicted Ser/Thr protein kinase